MSQIDMWLLLHN